jgi:hypothetical protein
MLQQKRKHLEGLILKLQADAVLVYLARTEIHLEGAEAGPTGSDSGFHGKRSNVPAVYHQLLEAGMRA